QPVLLGQFPGLSGQIGGGADIARQVAQIAGQAGAVADRLTVGDGPLQDFGIGLVRRPQGAFLQPRLVGLLALELVELIQALAGGLHQQAGTGVEVAVLDRQGGEGQQGVGGAAALRPPMTPATSLRKLRSFSSSLPVPTSSTRWALMPGRANSIRLWPDLPAMSPRLMAALIWP